MNDELELGAACPECEADFIRLGHLVDAERTDRLIETYERACELSQARVLYCPECWRFWAIGHH